MAVAYIGIGTNIGNRQDNLKEAVEYLKSDSKVYVASSSSIKETEPVDYLDQPNFLNQIINIETEYSPEELLEALQAIENKMGRVKEIPGGPRIIDLDILLFDHIIFDSPYLTIPHREIKNRMFIIEHLIELNPELRDPLSKKKYKEFIL
ncbi:2-amino-4-hydroxy-6-hydroxymethyldihydropteridine diphosphokinase [Spirochaetota bacterium]